MSFVRLCHGINNKSSDDDKFVNKGFFRDVFRSGLGGRRIPSANQRHTTEPFGRVREKLLELEQTSRKTPPLFGISTIWSYELRLRDFRSGMKTPLAKRLEEGELETEEGEDSITVRGVVTYLDYILGSEIPQSRCRNVYICLQKTKATWIPKPKIHVNYSRALAPNLGPRSHQIPAIASVLRISPPRTDGPPLEIYRSPFAHLEYPRSSYLSLFSD